MDVSKCRVERNAPSSSSDEDRRRGLAAGFRAYLVKGQFDQMVFLNTVRGLIGDVEDDT